MRVNFSVYRNGEPESFDGASNIVTKLVNEAYNKLITHTYTIAGNIVQFDIDALQLTQCGKCRLFISYTKGGDYTVDSPAFELVNYTDQTGGTEIIGVEIVSINISGDIGINRDGLSAYEVWESYPGNEGKTIEQYFEWLRENPTKVDLDGLNSNLQKLHFNTAPTATLTNPGDIRYSSESNALELQTPYGYMTLGRNTHSLAKNDTGTTLLKGEVVYIYGAVGANALARRATNADVAVAVKTFGLVLNNTLANNTGGILTEGTMRNLNTLAWPEGSMLWLGVNGAITITEPTAPAGKVSLGMVLRSHANEGVVYVKIVPIYRMSRLTDVYAPTPTGGDILRFNSTTLRFETFNVTTALSTKTDTSRSVIAGNGLTGGGTFQADRTINVVNTDDSIVVAEDSIKVNTNNTLTSTSITQPLSANQGKVLNEKAVQLETDLNELELKVANIKDTDETDDTLFIVDSSGNIVAKIDNNGIKAIEFIDKNNTVLSVKIAELVQSIKEKVPLSNSEEILIDDSSNEFCITDINGYVIVRLNNHGINVNRVRKFYGYQLITIGDSLSSSNVWNTKCAELLGCTFDSEANIKVGRMISQGGTRTWYGAFDSAFYRCKNLVDQGIIKNGGEKTIIILENINDYNAGEPNGSIADNSVIPTTPIETNKTEAEFTTEYLQSISTQAHLDACCALVKQANGKVLKITSLPSVEGNVLLRVGGSGTGYLDYSIHIAAPFTIENIINKILEYSYTGITDMQGTNVDEVIFAAEGTGYSTYVQFVDTDNTGMAATITDTSDAKVRFSMFFKGALNEWSDLTKWEKGTTYMTAYRSFKSCIEYLISNYPKANIIITSFPLNNVNPSTYVNSNGFFDQYAYSQTNYQIWMDEFIEVHKSICKLYNIHHINVAELCGISLTNFSNFYNSNDVHPKIEGYYRFAECVASWINNNLK